MPAKEMSICRDARVQQYAPPMEVQGIGGHEERDKIILDNQMYKFCLLHGKEEVFYATGIKKKPTCRCPSARVNMSTGFLGFGVPRVGV